MITKPHLIDCPFLTEFNYQNVSNGTTNLGRHFYGHLHGRGDTLYVDYFARLLRDTEAVAKTVQESTLPSESVDKFGQV